jgi:hypothetical protein
MTTCSHDIVTAPYTDTSFLGIMHIYMDVLRGSVDVVGDSQDIVTDSLMYSLLDIYYVQGDF